MFPVSNFHLSLVEFAPMIHNIAKKYVFQSDIHLLYKMYASEDNS